MMIAVQPYTGINTTSSMPYRRVRMKKKKFIFLKFNKISIIFIIILSHRIDVGNNEGEEEIINKTKATKKLGERY
jgi:hypothetical protein